MEKNCPQGDGCYKKYFDIAKVVNANIGNIEIPEISKSSQESISSAASEE